MEITLLQLAMCMLIAGLTGAIITLARVLPRIDRINANYHAALTEHKEHSNHA